MLLVNKVAFASIVAIASGITAYFFLLREPAHLIQTSVGYVNFTDSRQKTSVAAKFGMLRENELVIKANLLSLEDATNILAGLNRPHIDSLHCTGIRNPQSLSYILTQLPRLTVVHCHNPTLRKAVELGMIRLEDFGDVDFL